MVVIKKKIVVVARKPVVVRRPASPSPAVVRRAFNTGTQGDLLDKKRENVRREKLAHLIALNIGRSKPRPLYELCIEAGYTESTAKSRVSELVAAAREEPEVQDHLVRLRSLREKTLKRLEAETEKANYGSLAFGLQVLEKNIALLEGKPTERVENALTDEDREMLDTIMADNS